MNASGRQRGGAVRILSRQLLRLPALDTQYEVISPLKLLQRCKPEDEQRDSHIKTNGFGGIECADQLKWPIPLTHLLPRTGVG